MNNFRIAIYVAFAVGLLFAYGLYQIPKNGAGARYGTGGVQTPK